MKSLGRLLRWVLFALGGLVAFAVLAFVAVFGLAQSEVGRAWIAATVTRAISTPGQFVITLDRLEGALPRSIGLQGLTLADGDGVWLRLESATLDWRPLALLDGTLHISEIALTGLEVGRAPTSPDEPEDTSPQEFTLPSLPVALILEHLSVADLSLGAPLLGVPVSYRITGQGASEGTERLNASFAVDRSDGIAGRIAIEAAFDLATEHLRVVLELDEPAGGLISQLAEQPDLPASTLRFSGDGTLAEWRGHLSARVEGLAEAALNLTLDRSEVMAFGLAGRITAEPVSDAPLWPLLAGQSDIALEGTWTEQQVLDLRTLSVTTPLGDLTASGRVDLSNERVDLRAELDLNDPRRLAPLMAPADFAAANLTISAAGPLMQPTLKVDAAVERLAVPQATAEGVVIQATFQPDGPLDQGQLAGAFSIHGQVTKPRLEGQDALAEVIGETVPWEIDGRVDLATNRLEISSLSLDAADLGLTGSGQADLASLAAEAEIKLSLGSLAALAPLIGLELQGSAQTSVRARVAPEAQSVEAELDSSLNDFTLSDPVLAEPTAALLGATPKAQVTATFEPAGRLKLTSLTLEGKALSAEASADIGLEPLAGTAEAKLALSDLSGLSGTAGVPLAGTLEITGQVNLAEEIAATLDARLRNLAIDDPAIAPWLDALAGPDPDLSLAATMAPDGTVRLDSLDLQGVALRAGAQGTLSPGFDTLAMHYDLELPVLDVLSGPLGLPVAGQLRLTGGVDGAVADPSVRAKLTVEQGRVDAARFSRLETEVNAETVVSAPKAQVKLALATPQGDVDGEAKLALESDVLKISALGLRAEGASVEGVITAPLDGAPASGELDLDLTTLTPWLALAGLDGGGAISAKAVLRPAGPTQAATLEARLSDITYRVSPEQTLNLDAVELSAEGDDLTGMPEASLAITGSGLALGEARLDTFSAKGNGGTREVRFELKTDGEVIEPLTLATAGQVGFEGQALILTIASLDGSLIGEDIHLKSPLSFSQDGGAFALSDLDLSFGPATLSGDARLDDGGVDADLELRDLPLALARLADPTLDLGGTLSAELRLQGPLADPRGTAALSVRDLHYRDLKDVPKVSSDIEAQWRDGRLALTGTVSGIPGAGADLRAELPLRLVPATYALDLPRDQAISGELTWQGRLGRLWSLVPQHGHEVDGEMDLKVALSGTLVEPQVSGHLDLTQGAYENLESGTLLRDLAVNVAVAQDRVAKLSVRSTDGGNGRLNLDGDVKIDPEEAFPFDINTDFQEFTLVRRDDVTARANGKIRLHGTAERADLEGQVETRRIEIRIYESLPPAVADLQVVEEDKAPGEGDKTSQAEKAAPFDLGLDLTVTMPARVYVRGRGLESEWAGELKVAGSAASPRIDGELTLVRGSLALVGKSFRLDSGKVRFVGGDSIDPLIDVAAIHRGDDFTATIRLAGQATRPELIMTSVPELPQDEILARVLFNKSASELSTTEALQLAAAVAELTGKGGDSILEATRQLLGVDVLRLESSEDDSATPTVAAGKYVADNVYVGVKQGATATSSAVEVEVELTPNISVGSEMGQDGNSNVGIEFKWDY